MQQAVLENYSKQDDAVEKGIDQRLQVKQLDEQGIDTLSDSGPACWHMNVGGSLRKVKQDLEEQAVLNSILSSASRSWQWVQHALQQVNQVTAMLQMA